MDWICPVCNGLSSSHIDCPSCCKPMQDEGRISDFLGDYSPYRPIDDLKQSNGFPDLTGHLCLHAHSCGYCQRNYIVSFKEESEPELLTALLHPSD